MKQNTFTLPIVGGGIAFLCFFLPWFKIDMSAMGMSEMLPNIKVAMNISGFRSAIGNISFVTLAFIAAMAIVGICIYRLYQQTPWKSRTIVLISSVIGLFGILFTLISVLQGVGEVTGWVEGLSESTGRNMDLSNIFTLQIGGFGAAIGFMIAFIGGRNIPKYDTSPEDTE